MYGLNGLKLKKRVNMTWKHYLSGLTMPLILLAQNG